MVAQYDKMAYGHNLQAGDHHIRFTHDWKYITYEQAEDRSHREGRVGAVTYWDLVCRNTVDVEILAALRRHQNTNMRLTPETVAR